ncbi:hypothetical protein F4808DRAFT_171989 [Astrocystis sublimbata]|nr:hypothetical protein F4808DRAFT_171989 [Astrocystis sublimbata]
MDWDAATASAVAALVVAIIALFVAFAQATQQYLITGQLIRLCDSVVYGPMPGQGRRVWQFSQFRFRVIYSIPQISLETYLWPSGSAHMKSHAIGEHALPPLADTNEKDTTSLDRFSLPVALYEGELSKKPNKRGFFNWFRRKNEQQSESNHSSSSSEHTRAIIPARKRFKISIPIPAVLRRRRRSVGSSVESSSYTSSSYTSNRITRDPSRMYRRGQSDEVIIIPRDSTDSGSSYSPPLESSRKTSHIGEASWVSFCRAIETTCRHSVRIDFVEYDADRCPSDLISVPMQVSMRDIVIMALMAGMEITSASFHDKSISMQGAAGTLTSSNHAILGPILHYTPRNAESSLPVVFGDRRRDVSGKINKLWMVRTWDTTSVAGSFYNSLRRRTVRRLDERWIRDREGAESYDLDEYISDQGNSSRRKKKAKAKARVARPSANSNIGDEAVGEKAPLRQTSVNMHNRYWTPERRMQDGDWMILHPVALPEPISNMKLGREPSSGHNVLDENEGSGSSAPFIVEVSVKSGLQDAGTPEISTAGRSEGENDISCPPPPPRQATVEEVPDKDRTTVPTSSSQKADSRISLLLEQVLENERNDEKQESPGTPPPSERVKLARERQNARGEKLRQIQEDKAAVDNVLKRGAMGSPYEEAAGRLGQSRKNGPLLLTNYAHFPGKQMPPGSGPTAEEEAAHERETTREKQRRERNQAREDRNRARNRAVELTKMDMFWLCQTDVMSGVWATPWELHLPIASALDGAVTVILEALLGFLDENSSLCYTDSNYPAKFSYKRTADWMLQGNLTYPAYGQNARGGVIATGTYRGVYIPCFESMIPRLELLHSYSWQVDGDLHDRSEHGEEQNIELMRLDAWLSYVGRLPEIADGPHRLLRQAPALVHLLIENFEIDFQNIDLSAREGGLQDIQGLAENVMDSLTDEELTQPEQLYILVALLRGVKAAHCVLAGSDTRDVMDILLKDVQAHLV